MKNNFSPEEELDEGRDKEQNSLATLLRTLKLLVLLSHTTGKTINQLREHLSEKKEISLRPNYSKESINNTTTSCHSID
jgi:hypothetical protein